jgi:hypothetical protein
MHAMWGSPGFSARTRAKFVVCNSLPSAVAVWVFYFAQPAQLKKHRALHYAYCSNLPHKAHASHC